MTERSRLARITLPPAPDSGLLGPERRRALDDLTSGSHLFQPRNDNHGPYDLDLSIQEGRLVMRIRNARTEDLSALVLSVGPYRRLIHDYFLIVDSYEQARHHTGREKLEALDMARRSLHNEGADLLRHRLDDKIMIDLETARRLFTLICVLHGKYLP